MNKAFKIIAVVGAVLLVIGGIVFSATFPYNGDYEDIFKKEFISVLNDDVTIDGNGINKIEITTFFDIRIENSSSEEFNFTASGKIVDVSPNNSLNNICEKNGDTLKILYAKRHNDFSLFFMCDAQLVLKIPKSYTGDISVDTLTGNAELLAVNKFNSFDVGLTTGNVTGNVKANNFNAKLTTGRLTLNSIECNNADFVVTTGSLIANFANVKLVTLNLTTGNATLGFPQKNDFEIDFICATGNMINEYAASYPRNIDNSVSIINGDPSSSNDSLIARIIVTTGSVKIK